MVRVREGVEGRQALNTFWNETMLRKEGGKQNKIGVLIHVQTSNQ